MKQQIRSLKKCYAVDPGYVNATAFKFSENSGRLLENIVYLELRRRGCDVYSYKTERDLEVDFIAKHKNELSLIQVTQTLGSEITRKREIAALTTALAELTMKQGIIIAADEEDEMTINEFLIKVVPVYKFLLDR